jgi:hypothetical protein
MARSTRSIESGLQITEAGAGVYEAVRSTRAASAQAATEETLAEVELFLRLLAVAGFSFKVETLSVEVAAVASAPAQVDISRAGDDIVLSMQDIVSISDSLAIVMKRVDFERERAVLSRKSELPDHVALGLELNYLSVTSHSVKTRFLLTMTALDMLTTSCVGDAASIIKSTVPETAKRKELKRRLTEVLSEHGLDDAATKRVINSVSAAQVEPRAARIHLYLKSRDSSGVTQDQVSSWWSLRGRVAHGQTVDPEELIKHSSASSSALRCSLGQELATG